MDSDVWASTQIRKHQFGLQLLCGCSNTFCAYFLKRTKQLETTLKEKLSENHVSNVPFN